MTPRIFAVLVPLGLLTGTAPAAATDVAALPAPVESFLVTLFVDHPRTQLFETTRARAAAEAKAAGQATYNPDLEFDATPVLSSPPETKLSPQYTGAVRLPIDISGKSTLKGRLGDETAQAVAAEGRQARTALAADILAALAERETALARLAAATRLSGLTGQILDIALQRQKAGEISATEFGAAQLSAAEAKRAEDEAGLALVSAEEGLRATCLCEIETAPTLPAQLIPPPTLSEEQVQDIAERRPEIEAAKRRVAAARQGIDLARAQRIPDPTIRLGGSSEGEEKRLVVGLSIPIPVFNSGSAEIVAAGRALAEAEAQDRLVRQETAQAIRKAARAYRRAFDAETSWRAQMVPAVASQSALLTRLWRAGDLSATELLVQMRETARTETAAIEARASVWNAYADLVRAASLDPVRGSVRHD